MIPSLGPIRNATTIFATTRRTPRASSAAGAHIRRTNPRDALKDTITNVNIHRIVRRGFVYGPMLPEGRWKTTAWTGDSVPLDGRVPRPPVRVRQIAVA